MDRERGGGGGESRGGGEWSKGVDKRGERGVDGRGLGKKRVGTRLWSLNGT